MSEIPDFEPESMAPGLILGCLLSMALIGATLSWSLFGAGDSFDAQQKAHIHSGAEFPRLAVDTQKLRDSRRAHYQEPDLDTIEDEVKQLHTAFREINRVQFPSHSPDEENSSEQLELLIPYLAGQIVSTTRADGFAIVGEPLFEQCLEGLDQVLAAISSDNLPMSQALEDPPANRFSLYRNNCGNLLPELTAHELISTGGEWLHPEGRILVDIFQRYRWADLVRKDYPLHAQLSDYELQLFYQWRIESAAAFSLDQRKQFLIQAAPFLPEDYDASLTQARLDALEANSDQAVSRFQQLRNEHPENEFYDAIYAEVERQARHNEP